MQETLHSQLEANKSYYIELLYRGNNNNLICMSKRLGVFDKFEHSNFVEGSLIACFKHFRKLPNNIFNGTEVKLNPHNWRFYEAKKQIIQQNMESRVCSILLKRITGDEYFISGF